MDVAISIESGDNRFVAVAGYDPGEGTKAEVWYYEIGALGAGWEEITTTAYDGYVDMVDDQDKAGAVAFSPNFNSDEIMLVVTQDDGTNEAYLNVFSFNTEDWNDSIGGFSGYPVGLNTEDDAIGTTDLVAAEIAASPDYLGSDDDLRQVFVGIAHASSGANEADGIFFCDDDDAEALETDELIHSVDFDGTNLVAGSHDGTTVFFSPDPLEGDDADVDNSSSTKSPGGGGETVVRFCGDVVAAATVGDDHSFAVSRDLGENFNDINLIDGSISTALDFAISADGSAQYLLTHDGSDVSLWVWNDDSELWERIRWFDDYNTDFGDDLNDVILRIAPDDPDVVYLAEIGSTSMFYSSDGGASKWHNRSSRYTINDVAVETTGEVLYNLTTNGYVSKSTNTGFTWGSKETSKQAGDYSIVSLGEDLVIVGGDSTNPSVAYSTDGNESWEDLDEVDSAGNVQVTASGLADGDWLYACTDDPGSVINRWEIGDGEWEDDLGELPSAYMCRGIGLAEGVLYILSNNGTADSLLTRFLDPSGDEEGDESTAAADAVFNATPTALRISSGSALLWTVDPDAGELWMFEDTIALVGPTLVSPADGFLSPINEISGGPANINLVWESQSDSVEEFKVEVAYDTGFDQKLSLPDGGVVSNGFDEEDVGNLQISGDTVVFDTTFHWRVKVTDPVESPWSETRSFTVAEAEAMPPVEVEIPPAPEITIDVPPAPEVVLPAPIVQIPEEPAIPPALLWAVVAIGAILVIALIVLIYRTRKIT
jgi:hypothetical protein